MVRVSAVPFCYRVATASPAYLRLILPHAYHHPRLHHHRTLVHLRPYTDYAHQFLTPTPWTLHTTLPTHTLPLGCTPPCALPAVALARCCRRLVDGCHHTTHTALPPLHRTVISLRWDHLVEHYTLHPLPTPLTSRGYHCGSHRGVVYRLLRGHRYAPATLCATPHWVGTPHPTVPSRCHLPRVPLPILPAVVSTHYPTTTLDTLVATFIGHHRYHATTAVWWFVPHTAADYTTLHHHTPPRLPHCPLPPVSCPLFTPPTTTCHGVTTLITRTFGRYILFVLFTLLWTPHTL